MSKNNQKLPDTNSSFNSSLFDFPSDKMSLNDSRIKSTRSNHKTENYFYGNISQNDKNSSDKINPIQCGTNRDTLQLESLQPIDNDDNDNPFPLEVSMSNIHNDSFNKNNPFKKKKPDLIIDIDLGEGQNEKLILKYDEDPQLAAHRFCQVHDLDEEVVPMLVETIIQYMGTLYKKQELHSKNTSVSSAKDNGDQVINEKDNGKKMTGHFGEEERPNLSEFENFQTNSKGLSNENSKKKFEETNINRENHKEVSISADEEKPAFYVTINISEDEKYEIPVFENDDPVELATLFCKNNDMDDSAIEYVAEIIYNQLVEYQKKKSIRHSKQSSMKSIKQDQEEVNLTPRTPKNWNNQVSMPVAAANSENQNPFSSTVNNKYTTSHISHGNYPSPFSDRGSLLENTHNQSENDNKYNK